MHVDLHVMTPLQQVFKVRSTEVVRVILAPAGRQASQADDARAQSHAARLVFKNKSHSITAAATGRTCSI